MKTGSCFSFFLSFFLGAGGTLFIPYLGSPTKFIIQDNELNYYPIRSVGAERGGGGIAISGNGNQGFFNLMEFVWVWTKLIVTR